MDSGADRRAARRFTMSLPISVSGAEIKGGELPVRMRDVSYKGLYFFAKEEFAAGGQIDFIITLPQNISPSESVKIRCHGEIVRVERNSDGSGDIGVAAKIQSYEFISSAAAA